MQCSQTAFRRFFRLYFVPKSGQESATRQNGVPSSPFRARQFQTKSGTLWFFKVFLIRFSLSFSTPALSPHPPYPRPTWSALKSQPIGQSSLCVPVPFRSLKRHTFLCTPVCAASPTLTQTKTTIKTPSSLWKKKTRGKINLPDCSGTNQCKIKKNSSFIKSSDEIAGLSTPLLRASVRRIWPIISITFRPV